VLSTDASDQLLGLSPLLDPRTRRVLAELAGVARTPRRIWAGQPGPRSPWLPCRGGCCLVLESPAPSGSAEWLRFLVREVLAPQARASVVRARSAGLRTDVEPFRLSGELVLDLDGRVQLLRAAGRLVRVTRLDDDLLPLRPAPRRTHAGEVVDLVRPPTTEQ
jgi:hypothetical protein